ncbi:hypothetical protein E2C01_073286 [Portunus trituberculatus]|uniref:Uncharacterized protein n=1 Tax=Portunus trituberculatus TaxID=210409 RepID=A0A5B7IA65_PORTR|nr:hypothetical protein [Portunus trituberculatus]
MRRLWCHSEHGNSNYSRENQRNTSSGPPNWQRHYSRENQRNTSSGPPNWQRQNARGISAWGYPEEELEK